jgi:hypothetical protein
MIQIAEFTGAAGPSWLVAFVNVMAVIIVRRIVGELGPQFPQTHPLGIQSERRSGCLRLCARCARAARQTSRKHTAARHRPPTQHSADGKILRRERGSHSSMK